MKDKLVSFPEEILDILDEYKQKTGVPATDYIRLAVIKKMIEEKLIFIKVKYITIKKKGEDDIKLSKVEASELNKFCDGESCEIPVLIDKNH